MVILFKNARILTMKDDKIFQGNIVVQNNRIAYIGNDYQAYAPFEREVDCHNNLLMPGFKNPHAHSGMVFVRDLVRNVSLQEWLFKYIFPREDHLIPEDIYHLNKVAYLEYVSGGITAVFEHYFFPDSSAKAAEEFGMRTLLLGTYDVKKTGVEKLVERVHYYNDRKDPLVRFVIGFHAEYTSDEELVAKTKEAIDIAKTPFFTHISETQKEVDECVQRHGLTPAELFYKRGLFAYGGGGYHCSHFTDEEVKIFKENNLTIISCPGSNKQLASGDAPLNKYFKEGVRIALGTDGPASNDRLDMFYEMQLAVSNNGFDVISPFEYLKMITVNGAIAMDIDAEYLEVGKLADIIMLDMSNLEGDIISNIVNKGSVNDVKLTMINGKVLYENGKYFFKESVEEINKKAQDVKNRIEAEMKK